MDFLSMNTLGFPILSLLIFLPLAGAAVVPLLRGDNLVRIWTLAVTLVNAGLSLPLYTLLTPRRPCSSLASTARGLRPSMSIIPWGWTAFRFCWCC